MLDEVRRHIRREKLLEEGQAVWVAVSGGVDSMVLLRVLRELGHPCTVAHVDHGLRGAESDADRHFVEDHCRALGLSFRSLQVDVNAHAEANELSVQLAGRGVRYAWFAELWGEQPMPIAMGHHANDAVESLFINLMRGTGAQGWGTIRPKSGIHIRPLLCVGREEILRFADQHRVPFREDASNADPKYLRNRIRHEVIPMLEALRPGAMGAMARSVGLLRELEEAGQQVSIAALAGIIPSADGSIRVPFARVEDSPVPDLVLHRLLRHLGFHPATLDRIREAIADRSTGAHFHAGSWQVVVDRELLIIAPSTTDRPVHVIELDEDQGVAGGFRWEMIEGGPGALPASAHEALLDVDRLTFPLVLRPWRAGDRIRPMGMTGSRAVSDILIDAKVPLHEKAGVHVLESAGTLVWVAGHRIAEGYQVSQRTKRSLRISRVA